MKLRSLFALTLVVAACSDSALAPTQVSDFTEFGVLADSKSGSSASTKFAVIANAAVTCTDGSIVGDVATFQATPTGSFTQTTCPLTGFANVGNEAARAAYASFLEDYADLAPSATTSCTLLTGTLDGIILAPGSYCFAAAAALTGTLTLIGPSNGEWLFRVGTGGTGALTGTNFSIVLASDANACNVTWWVAEAVTMTTSNFAGNVLAGAAITMTGGTWAGNAWTTADVTNTGTALVGCESTQDDQDDHDEPGKPHKKCKKHKHHGKSHAKHNHRDHKERERCERGYSNDGRKNDR